MRFDALKQCDEPVGWAQERSDVPTIYQRARCEMVGTLTLCPPYNTYTATSCSPAAARFGRFTFDGP